MTSSPATGLDATEQLLDFGGQKDLVDFVRVKTNDGRLIVRFLLDVAQRKIDDVTERDRVKGPPTPEPGIQRRVLDFTAGLSGAIGVGHDIPVCQGPGRIFRHRRLDGRQIILQTSLIEQMS